MSDPPRQVNVGRGDGDFAIGLVNAYDPLKGETRSARSVWRTRSTISCLCVAKKLPLKITSPAGYWSLMRWQAGQSSFSSPSVCSLAQCQRPQEFTAPHCGHRHGLLGFLRALYVV